MQRQDMPDTASAFQRLSAAPFSGKFTDVGRAIFW